jgi:hypothetical protein
MKNIKLLYYLVYSFFREGKYTKDVAYLKTTLIFAAVLSLDMMPFLRLFHLDSFASFIGFGDYHRWEAILRLGIFVMLPVYVITRILIKENDLKTAAYDQPTINKGKLRLLSFSLFSLMWLITYSLLKNYWMLPSLQH